jgi:hypothetical protein
MVLSSILVCMIISNTGMGAYAISIYQYDHPTSNICMVNGEGVACPSGLPPGTDMTTGNNNVLSTQSNVNPGSISMYQFSHPTSNICMMNGQGVACPSGLPPGTDMTTGNNNVLTDQGTINPSGSSSSSPSSSSGISHPGFWCHLHPFSHLCRHTGSSSPPSNSTSSSTSSNPSSSSTSSNPSSSSTSSNPSSSSTSSNPSSSSTSSTSCMGRHHDHSCNPSSSSDHKHRDHPPWWWRSSVPADHHF